MPKPDEDARKVADEALARVRELEASVHWHEGVAGHYATATFESLDKLQRAERERDELRAAVERVRVSKRTPLGIAHALREPPYENVPISAMIVGTETEDRCLVSSFDDDLKDEQARMVESVDNLYDGVRYYLDRAETAERERDELRAVVNQVRSIRESIYHGEYEGKTHTIVLALDRVLARQSNT
ncbi:MAG: hypothetical protein NVS3B3_09230 [Aquirhabdus sp.]